MSVTVEDLLAQSRAATDPTEARRLRTKALQQQARDKVEARRAAMTPEQRENLDRIRANCREAMRQREVATVLLETQPAGDGLPFPE